MPIPPLPTPTPNEPAHVQQNRISLYMPRAITKIIRKIHKKWIILMFRVLVFHFNPTYLTLIGNGVVFILRSPVYIK